jgi:choline kinase
MRPRRALVVTVAGVSARFRRSVGRDVLKCLYHEGHVEDSILHFTASFAVRAGFDVVRFVGGYQYDGLTAALDPWARRARTSGRDLGCIFNPEFESKGTAQTVYLGFRAVVDDPGLRDVGEIVLLEGDVVGDGATFEALAEAPGDVLTICCEPITASESVALYRTAAGELRFAFDPDHRSLTIVEPFEQIYNSGQAWKLADMSRLRHTMDALTDTDLCGTCLVILERYFQHSPAPELIAFESWTNCNTVEDYRSARGLLRREVDRWNS